MILKGIFLALAVLVFSNAEASFGGTDEQAEKRRIAAISKPGDDHDTTVVRRHIKTIQDHGGSFNGANLGQLFGDNAWGSYTFKLHEPYYDPEYKSWGTKGRWTKDYHFTLSFKQSMIFRDLGYNY